MRLLTSIKVGDELLGLNDRWRSHDAPELVTQLLPQKIALLKHRQSIERELYGLMSNQQCV